MCSYLFYLGIVNTLSSYGHLCVSDVSVFLINLSPGIQVCESIPHNRMENGQSNFD